MKILYIFLDGRLNGESGVHKKIQSKAEVLISLGHKVDLISFSTEIDSETQINNYFKLIPVPKIKFKKFFQTIQYQKHLYSTIDKYLENNIMLYDNVVFRYPLASKYLYSLVEKYTNKISFEHNTKEIEELEVESKLRRKGIPFSLKPGFFIYFFERVYYPLFAEKIYGKKIFGKAKCGICVTKEIADYESKRNKKYKTFVVSNGINIEKISLNNAVYEGEKLKLIMLKGYEGMWHGLSRLLLGIKNYKGKVNIELKIIGYVSEEEKKLVENLEIGDNIIFVNPLKSIELDAEIKGAHIGVGSLGLHRINLFEASPLKVREYAARGIPFITGYNDTDLINNKNFEGLYLQFPADESQISIEKIVSFSEKVYSKKDVNLELRLQALKFLDMKVKMGELVNHLLIE